MSDDLPSSYDVIILGTGMVESIVAAAVARTGKKVLHLDPNTYYGQLWATLSLDSFELWAKTGNSNAKTLKGEDAFKSLSDKALKYYETQDERDCISDLTFNWNIVEEIPETEEEAKEENASGNEYSVKKIRDVSRKFNIDLAPKLLFAKGPMVEILIKSQVSKYVEFLNVNNILIYIDDAIERVPCSKSDVFSSKSVNVVDKRLLMKVLTSIQSYTEESPFFQEYEDKTFLDYLKANLPEKFANFILYSIAAGDQTTPCLEGVQKAKKFLSCLGYYGNSPFLWPLYGSSELLQGFCRQCAVFSGIYCLNREVEAIAVEGDKYYGCASNGILLQSDHLVISNSLLPQQFRGTGPSVKRAVLITDKSIFPEGKEGVSLLQYPTDDSAATILELSGNTCSVPKGLFIVQIVGNCLEEAIKNLFTEGGDDSKPKILYSIRFTLHQMECTSKLPENIHACPGPDFATDFDAEIRKAEEIFKKICPEEEFFAPLPPEPEPPSDEPDSPEEATNDA